MTPIVDGNNAKVEVEVWTKNADGKVLNYTITDAQDNVVAETATTETRSNFVFENAHNGRKDPYLYTATNPPNYGDGNARSILDMLFCHYEEFNRFDIDAIQEGFQQVYNELDEVSLQQLDYVIHKTCELCREHEMAGFTEGIKVDVKLRLSSTANFLRKNFAKIHFFS